MKLKKGISVLSGLVLCSSVVLSACGGGSSAPASQQGGSTPAPAPEKKEEPKAEAKPITLKVANYFATDHPQNVALRDKFKPMVEEKSNGTIKVEIYDNSKLGAEKEFYDGVRNGTIEMGIPGMIMQADVPKMGVGEWPFLFNDFDHAKKVFTGPIGEEMAADLEAQGVHALAWSANGFRMISSNKPIKSMDDFKNFRLRTPNIPMYIKFGELLGANITPMPISEVFTALEQNVVDGQDNPIATTRASGWYEVQSHVLEFGHVFSPNVYIINSKLWGSLTPEQQQIIEESAKASADYEWGLLEESFEADKKFLQEHGIEFIQPDEQFKQQMVEAVQPIYEDYYKQFDWAKEMVEKIRAEGK